MNDAAHPLKGKRVVVTRAREQSKGLVERLQSLGAEVIECPAIAIAPPHNYAPVDEAIMRLDTYDWLIFTSVNAVQSFASRLAEVSGSTETLAARKVCAVGPATAAALRKLGCEPTLVPTVYVAEAILNEIGDVDGRRVLLPAADIARETLAEGLLAKGAQVEQITVYRTVADEGSVLLADLLVDDKVDAITFTSSSTVRNTFDRVAGYTKAEVDGVQLLNRTKVVCIGPVTAGTAQELGLRVDAVASEHTTEGLVAALIALLAGDQGARSRVEG